MLPNLPIKYRSILQGRDYSEKQGQVKHNNQSDLLLQPMNNLTLSRVLKAPAQSMPSCSNANDLFHRPLIL